MECVVLWRIVISEIQDSPTCSFFLHNFLVLSTSKECLDEFDSD
jgi:hypothetical protein